MTSANPGMDPDTFEQFIDQLQRYVRERLIPAEAEVIERNEVPPEIIAEMRDMGLFGLTMPEEYGGAGAQHQPVCRDDPGHVLCHAGLSLDHLDQHRHGLFGDQELRRPRSRRPHGCRGLHRARSPASA